MVMHHDQFRDVLKLSGACSAAFLWGKAHTLYTSEKDAPTQRGLKRRKKVRLVIFWETKVF